MLSIILLIIVSCQSNKKENVSSQISPEERVWLTQFFTDVLLAENGIYTLWGAAKPITIIQIDHYSEEQKKVFYDSLTEEEKKNGMVIVDYSLAETWEKWEQIRDRFPTKRYLLFKTDMDQDEDTFFVLFIDILKTAMVIQDNYEAFHKAMEFDFHPLELTLKMDQKNSVFWKKIEGNAHLLGILFGYGKINAYLFNWKYFDHPQHCDEFCSKINFLFSNDSIKGQIKFTIDNFLLPDFCSFNEIDSTIDIYKEERIKIKNIYKNQDFLDLTLKKLMD